MKFNETFALVARMETIRILLALIAQLKLKLFQLDIKSTLLEELEEEVYMEQPQAYTIKGEEHKVHHPWKTLYESKQVPCAWNSKIEQYFYKHDFQKSPTKLSLYVIKESVDFFIVCLYVDNLIYCITNMKMIEEFKKTMM